MRLRLPASQHAETTLLAAIRVTTRAQEKVQLRPAANSIEHREHAAATDRPVKTYPGAQREEVVRDLPEERLPARRGGPALAVRGRVHGVVRVVGRIVPSLPPITASGVAAPRVRVGGCGRNEKDRHQGGRENGSSDRSDLP